MIDLLLADGWWDAAGKQPEAIRGEILWHAATFYKTALESATGLQKSILERRIADASAARDKQLSGQLALAGGHVVRLLRLIDPEKDSVAGKFAIQNGELVQIGSGAVEGACKKIGTRLKLNSARWRVRRAERFGALLCLEYTDQARIYWRSRAA